MEGPQWDGTTVDGVFVPAPLNDVVLEPPAEEGGRGSSTQALAYARSRYARMLDEKGESMPKPAYDAWRHVIGQLDGALAERRAAKEAEDA